MNKKIMTGFLRNKKLFQEKGYLVGLEPTPNFPINEITLRSIQDFRIIQRRNNKYVYNAARVSESYSGSKTIHEF